MKENTVRVIKIGKEALYEFLYENIISQEESLLQVPATEVMNSFAMDWERGEFIFMAHQAEDADGELISLPKEIQPETLLKALPETTESLLKRGEVYRDYSFEELKRLCGENEDNEGKRAPFMKYRDWNEMQRKLEALYVLDNALRVLRNSEI